MIISDITQKKNFNWSDVVRITVTWLNAKSAVNTNFLLYTVPAGKTFIMTGHATKISAVTGAGNGWHVSIGTNAAAYNNMMSNVNMNTMDATGEIFQVSTIWVSVWATAGQVIRLNINTAATTTTMTVDVDIIGYLV